MTQKPIKIKTPPIKKICEKCNIPKPISDYYNGDKLFFPSGKINICKKCVLQIVEDNGHEGLMGLLRMLNKPFYQDLFKGDVADYVRQMASLPQYRNVGFTQSDTLVAINDFSSVKREKPTQLTEDEMKEAEDFWGVGFSESEMIWLSGELQEYGSQFDLSGKNMESLVREVCLTQLEIRNKRANKQDVKNELKTLQDLLGSSNLKPMQETGAQSIEQEAFGTLIKKWEDTTPIPDDEQWKDADTVGKYLKVWFTGHLMRMFGLENKDEQEYFDEINKYTVATNDTEDENEGENNGKL